MAEPKMQLPDGIPPEIDRYQLISLIGKGASAYVFKAHDPHLKRNLAIKVPKEELGRDDDFRKSFIREGRLLAQQKNLQVDWGAFADSWRAGYGPAMNKVRSGELPWTDIDDLHRMILDDLVIEFGLDGLSEAEIDHLNRAWHRLSPWPDTVGGLNRLKSQFIIATLSNGNVSLLTNMAKHAGLPWDAVFSAELAQHYKPDQRAYLKAVDLLNLQPAQVLMVAAHPGDLRAAAQAGLKTAYVYRPLEWGEERIRERNAAGEFDFDADSFLDLARQLGA